MHDLQLLEEYVTRNSETAFQSLVTRYLNLVRSTALRQVRDTPLAQDVAQTVFIELAREAGSLPGDVGLAGWLYRHTPSVSAFRARLAAGGGGRRVETQKW
jgi:DNA-directed RNA polymerase specialized sigma24 family protein